MNILRTIFLLLLTYNVSLSQNLKNNDSLRYGHWKVTYELEVEEGSYKIVSLRNYDTIYCRQEYTNDWTWSNCNVRYKKSNATIFFTIGISRDSISVNDGLWTSVDSSGNMTEKHFDNGVLLWTKEYNSQRQQTGYISHDYENDSTVFLTYRLGRIFKKIYYPPFDGNNSITQYYPDDDLVISNAEPRFSSNFLTKLADTVAINISSKTTSTLTEFNSKFLALWDKKFDPIQFPFKVTNSPTTLYLISKPNTLDCNIGETFSIKTKESPYSYEFNGLIDAAHVDASNLEQTSSITLSRSKDRYLWVQGNGSLNEVSITDQSESTKEFTIFGSQHLGIDLLDFAVGRYSLGIFMETIGNDITLIITP